MEAVMAYFKVLAGYFLEEIHMLDNVSGILSSQLSSFNLFNFYMINFNLI
jgi:hypothetical protein